MIGPRDLSLRVVENNPNPNKSGVLLIWREGLHVLASSKLASMNHERQL
jgi:hypothetical protein